MGSRGLGARKDSRLSSARSQLSEPESRRAGTCASAQLLAFVAERSLPVKTDFATKPRSSRKEMETEKLVVLSRQSGPNCTGSRAINHFRGPRRAREVHEGVPALKDLAPGHSNPSHASIPRAGSWRTGAKEGSYAGITGCNRSTITSAYRMAVIPSSRNRLDAKT